MSIPLMLIGAASLLLGLVWLLLTEFSYVSTILSRLVYDRTAAVYERKWRAAPYRSRPTSRRLLIGPILRAAAGDPQARVLDLACGTGRIPLLLLGEPEFKGRIVAVDYSPQMLSRLEQHLASLDEEDTGRVEVQLRDLAHWRCDAQGRFQVVTLMEASELIPGTARLLAEAAAALAPGGLLVVTKVTPWLAWAFPGRCQSRRCLQRMLTDCGLTSIETEPWRWRYEVVYAHKPTK